MVRITEELIKKKAEHHDGLLADLEELSLHQLEIERIEVLGSTCRKLRILYLQNNIIPKMEGLHHLKDLRYLNMALNNITRIEGLASCEFLTKLDLTVNFIDLDELEASMEHLSSLLHLNELYLMGNPCTEWQHYRAYVVCMLPGLRHLDGSDVTRTERIQAMQSFKAMRVALREAANAKRVEKGAARVTHAADDDDDEDDDNAPWCPETRVKMAREAAKQKEEQEARRKHMEPVKRNYEAEQAAAVAKAREREAADAGPDGRGPVRQCNEGRWHFELDDEDGHCNVVLRLSLPKFLDTSLIDVDVHPAYVSVVIRGKVFRLLWPEEVASSAGSCKRSQTTGELVITVPKVKQNHVLAAARRRERAEAAAGGKDAGEAAPAAAGGSGSSSGLGASKWGRPDRHEESSDRAGSGAKPAASSASSRVDAVLSGRLPSKAASSSSKGGSSSSSSGSGKGRLADEVLEAAGLGGLLSTLSITPEAKAARAEAAAEAGEGKAAATAPPPPPQPQRPVPVAAATPATVTVLDSDDEDDEVPPLE